MKIPARLLSTIIDFVLPIAIELLIDAIQDAIDASKPNSAFLPEELRATLKRDMQMRVPRKPRSSTMQPSAPDPTPLPEVKTPPPAAAGRTKKKATTKKGN